MGQDWQVCVEACDATGCGEAKCTPWWSDSSVQQWDLTNTDQIVSIYTTEMASTPSGGELTRVQYMVETGFSWTPRVGTGALPVLCSVTNGEVRVESGGCSGCEGSIRHVNPTRCSEPTSTSSSGADLDTAVGFGLGEVGGPYSIFTSLDTPTAIGVGWGWLSAEDDYFNIPSTWSALEVGGASSELTSAFTGTFGSSGGFAVSPGQDGWYGMPVKLTVSAAAFNADDETGSSQKTKDTASLGVGAVTAIICGSLLLFAIIAGLLLLRRHRTKAVSFANSQEMVYNEENDDEDDKDEREKGADEDLEAVKQGIINDTNYIDDLGEKVQATVDGGVKAETTSVS